MAIDRRTFVLAVLSGAVGRSGRRARGETAAGVVQLTIDVQGMH